MSHIYVTCGEWIRCNVNGWSFRANEAMGGRLLALDAKTTLKELNTMVEEDYEIEQGSAHVKFGYVPSEFMNQVGSPPIFISNDRQVRNFVGYVKENSSIQLRVTFTSTTHNDVNNGFKDQNMKAPDRKVTSDAPKVPVRKSTTVTKNPIQNKKNNVHDVKDDDDDDSDDDVRSSTMDVEIVPYTLENVVTKFQSFESKRMLKSKIELCAMKYNFDYRVIKSDTTRWSIRCKNKVCNWGLCAHGVPGSKYFIITNYVAKHTCAPSSKTSSGKTASAKTIGRLIMHRYRDAKRGGPTPNDVMEMMRAEQGLELKYSLAYEAREYAINMVRGIPEKSYEKILRYLYMLKAANPGTHCAYETDRDDRFLYLFIAFGQSIRGYHSTMRKVIAVDGTFLKNKFRGTLLVATALDGNSNVYPLAFGIVDSENHQSWEWFLRQLSVVIPDEHGLVFVADRHGSIERGVELVYPNARLGICIHHLLNNVTSNYQGRHMRAFVAAASKVYRPPDFEKRFSDICNMSPAIGTYLMDADVRKWARCLFPGFRYDVRTNNPAETINSALLTPREYPVIPLLASITEMLTRWFHKRRLKSTKHTQPLTEKVEKKIARRIYKGRTFSVYGASDNRFVVKGDEYDCTVDLTARTCTCRKYNLIKIPCRHAIKAALFIGRDCHSLTDVKYTTTTWRAAYAESINPIAEPEDAWRVPNDIENVKVLPPYSRRTAGRPKKRRFKSVEDKIRSQGPQAKNARKCSRCERVGHNKKTCKTAI